MRPLEAKLESLVLTASLLVGGQAGCERRDPKDIARIEQLEGEIANKDPKVGDQCAEIRGSLGKCTESLASCNKAAAPQNDVKQEVKNAPSKVDEEAKAAEHKKAAVLAKVNKAIKEANIKNPTNGELIRKVFVSILNDDFSGDYAYGGISRAMGTYDLNSADESGILANDYAKKMDSAAIATDALAVFAKLDIADKMMVGKIAGEMIPKLEEAAALYPKYAALFRNGSFKRCMTIGSVWLKTDKENAEGEDKAKFDPICEDGGLVAKYHEEAPFDRFAMRQMDRLGVPASTVVSTAAKVRQAVFGK